MEVGGEEEEEEGGRSQYVTFTTKLHLSPKSLAIALELGTRPAFLSTCSLCVLFCAPVDLLALLLAQTC